MLWTFRFKLNTPSKSIWLRCLIKQTSLDNRNMDFKKPKNWHFFKVISPLFRSKSWSFLIFMFIKHRRRKRVCRRSGQRRSLSRLLKHVFIKSPKFAFFECSKSTFFVKSLRFIKLLVLCKIDQENSVWARSSSKSVYLCPAVSPLNPLQTHVSAGNPL